MTTSRPAALAFACVFASASVALSACHATGGPSPSRAVPDSMAIRRDIEYLAGPALAGRLTGTPENDSAAAYLARRYQSLGLTALSPGYLQHFVARPPEQNRR